MRKTEQEVRKGVIRIPVTGEAERRAVLQAKEQILEPIVVPKFEVMSPLREAHRVFDFPVSFGNRSADRVISIGHEPGDGNDRDAVEIDFLVRPAWNPQTLSESSRARDIDSRIVGSPIPVEAKLVDDIVLDRPSIRDVLSPVRERIGLGKEIDRIDSGVGCVFIQETPRPPAVRSGSEIDLGKHLIVVGVER